MADTITHTWQTVEQAAVTLNVSTRTIARRLAGGSLESRVDENGRRLVLVQQMTAGEPGQDAGTDAIAGDAGFDESAFALAATGSTTGLAVPAMPASLGPSAQATAMLAVLQSTVTAARDDARSARRSAKLAIAGMMAMAALIVVAAALVSSTLTRTTVTTGLLREQLAETKGDLRQTQAELMATRTAEAQATRDLGEARRSAEAARRSATPVTVAAPATQPSLIGRVAALFGE